MANNLKIIRLSRGLTQADVALKLKNRWGRNVTRRYVSSLERAINLSDESIAAICAALKIKKSALIQDGATLTVGA